MTKIQIERPDATAKAAQAAGLLSDSAHQELLEDAMRRRAGRRPLDVAERIHNAGLPPLSMEETDAEVKAIRTARRTHQGSRTPGDGADRS
ncbi:MAG: hypothetical protein ABSC95_15445 [Acetobacteraceae bacterium]|jgi:hypothetical protein